MPRILFIKPHELEFSISQYLDGQLDEVQNSALLERIENDASARNLLEEYQRLDVMMKSAPLPEVRWEALAGQISSAIDQAEEAEVARYRIPAWVKVAAPLAVAACLMIATGLAFRAFHTHPGHSIGPVAKLHVSPPELVVVGPQAERATGPAEVQVAIGPAKAIAGQAVLVQYSDEIISRPSHVAVASGMPIAREIESSSFDMQ